MKNLENEISSLKSTQESLDAAYKAADDKLSEAVTKAAAETEAAKVASIAAAQELVKNAIASMEASLQATETKLDSDIAGLVAVDATLQTAIDEAKADIKQAAIIANQIKVQSDKNATDIAAAATKLTTVEKTLREQQSSLNGLQTSVDGFNDAMAKLSSQYVALSAYNEKMSDLDKKDADLSKEIKALQEKLGSLTQEGEKLDVPGLIQKEVKVVQDALDAYKKANLVTTDAITAAYEKADKKHTDDIAALTTNLGKLDTKVAGLAGDIALINDKLVLLQFSNLQMVTGIILQAKTYEVNWGNIDMNNPQIRTVDGTRFLDFPYANAVNGTTMSVSSGSQIVDTDAGYLFATINPTTLDITGEKLSLENSLGEAPKNIKLGAAAAADKTIAIMGNGSVQSRAVVSKNGLWKLPIVISADKVNQLDGNGEAYAIVASHQYTVKMIQNEKEKDSLVTRKVYSKYAIDFDKAEAKTAINSFDVIVNNDRLAGDETVLVVSNGVNTPITATLSTSFQDNKYKSKKVYRQYTEIRYVNENGTTGKLVEEANISATQKLNTIFSGDLNVTEKNEITAQPVLANKLLRVIWYVQNYDGTIVREVQDVMFQQALLPAESITTSLTPTKNGQNVDIVTEFNAVKFISDKKWIDNVNSFDLVVAGSNSSADFTASFFKDKECTNPVGTNLKDAKYMKLSYNMSDFNGFNTSKDLTITFKDGLKKSIVNVLTVKTTLLQPNLDAFNTLNNRTAAAFSGDQTIAWAQTVNGSNIGAWFFRQSFSDVENTALNSTSFYAFLDRADANTYTGSKAIYKPVKIDNSPGEHNLIVNVKAVQDAYVYNFSEAVDYFDYFNNGTPKFTKAFDNFNLVFQSPIEKALLNTTKEIKLPYGKNRSIEIEDAMFSSIDPSNASEAIVENQSVIHYFEGRDVRIAKMSIEVDASSNSNRGLIILPSSPFVKGKAMIKSTEDVVITGDTKMKLKLSVTDIFGITSYKYFFITVTKPAV
ncbi:MAG: hypothetical protein RR386_07890 [Bacteroidaceae bacterium]